MSSPSFTMILQVYNFNNKNIVFCLKHRSVPNFIRHVMQYHCDKWIEFDSNTQELHYVAKCRDSGEFGWKTGGIKDLVLDNRYNHYIITNDMNIRSGVLDDICPNDAEPFFPIFKFDPKMIDNKTLFEYIYAYQTLGWKP